MHLRSPALPMRWLLLCGLLIPLLAVAGSAQADTHRGDVANGTPLRVMFVGDSITQGRQGDATLRYFVWREFVRQRVPVTFVGPSSHLGGHGQTRSFYLHNGLGFEKAHAAKGGSSPEEHATRIAARVATYKPDVISVLLGFNGTGSTRPGTLADEIATVLDRAWAVDPELRVVLGEITTSSRASYRTVGSRRNRIARRTSNLLAQRYAEDSRVTQARNMTAGAYAWNPRTDSYDGVHPNITGQRLLAYHVVTALHEAAVLPSLAPPPATEVWNAKPRVRAVRQGARSSVLAWPSEARRIGAQSLSLTIKARGRGEVFSRSFPTKVSAVRLRLAPGIYRARLTARRGTMLSPPGPRSRFRVR